MLHGWKARHAVPVLVPPHAPLLAAGPRHSLGLRTDGRVVAAGSNRHGQLDVDAWPVLRAPA